MSSLNSAPRVIEPWSGTGWPLSLFTERKLLLEIYFCARYECGRKNERITREPWQLSCGHRMCKACQDIIHNLPEAQQTCDACQLEANDDGNRLMMSNADVSGKTQGSVGMEIDDNLTYDAFPPRMQRPMDVEGDSQTNRLARIDFALVMKDNATNKEINRMSVKCPFDCSDPTPLTIRTLEKHMITCTERLVPCEKCSDTIAYSARSKHDTNTCPFRIIDCPNKCGKRGLRGKDLTQHLAECENKPPICSVCKNPYELGEDAHSHLARCVAKCPLDCGKMGVVNLVEHLNDKALMGRHLYSMMMLLDETKMALGNQTGASGTGTSKTQLSAFLDRLIQLESKTERVNRELLEKVNHLTGESAGSLMENARLAQKNRSDLNDLDSLFKVLAQDVHMLTSYDTTFRALTEKTTKKENDATEQLNKLETLSNIRVAEIEDQRTALSQLQMTSFNSHLVWRVDNIQRRREDAYTRHSIFSHPFYTEVYGYKMCARLYLNGDGNGRNSHISLFFVLMKGEFDALLTWPFQQKVTFKLRNVSKKKPDIVEKFRSDTNSPSFQKPRSERNVASGVPKFAEQSYVFNTDNGFLVDDTLFIEIIIDSSHESLNGLNFPLQEVTPSSIN